LLEVVGVAEARVVGVHPVVGRDDARLIPGFGVAQHDEHAAQKVCREHHQKERAKDLEDGAERAGAVLLLELRQLVQEAHGPHHLEDADEFERLERRAHVGVAGRRVGDDLVDRNAPRHVDPEPALEIVLGNHPEIRNVNALRGEGCAERKEDIEAEDSIEDEVPDLVGVERLRGVRLLAKGQQVGHRKCREEQQQHDEQVPRLFVERVRVEGEDGWRWNVHVRALVARVVEDADGLLERHCLFLEVGDFNLARPALDLDLKQQLAAHRLMPPLELAVEGKGVPALAAQRRHVEEVHVDAAHVFLLGARDARHIVLVEDGKGQGPRGRRHRPAQCLVPDRIERLLDGGRLADGAVVDEHLAERVRRPVRVLAHQLAALADRHDDLARVGDGLENRLDLVLLFDLRFFHKAEADEELLDVAERQQLGVALFGHLDVGLPEVRQLRRLERVSVELLRLPGRAATTTHDKSPPPYPRYLAPPPPSHPHASVRRSVAGRASGKAAAAAADHKACAKP